MIFKRTTKGNELVEQSKHLAHNIRHLLMLIDGKSSSGEIQKLFDIDITLTLKSLKKLGVVELVNGQTANIVCKAVSICIDLLHASEDIYAYEILTALENVTSTSEVKALIPHIIQSIENNTANHESIKQIYALINAE